MTKKLLVFGISGFTGKHFFHQCKDIAATAGIEIIGVAPADADCTTIGCAQIEILDARDGLAVKRLLQKSRPEYIANFIGLFRASEYEEILASNVDVSRHILQAVVDLAHQPQKLLFIGSAAEYGATTSNPVKESDPVNPISLYGLSKVFQTNLVQYYVRNFQIPAVIARTFNLTGSGISTALSVGNFQTQITAATSGDSIRVGNIETMRDFMPIEEAVHLYWKLLMQGEPGEIYNVCSGKPVKIGDLLRDMITASGKDLKMEVSTDLLRSKDVPCIYGDRGKLDRLLVGL